MAKPPTSASQWFFGQLHEIYHGGELDGMLRGTHVLPLGMCMGLAHTAVVHKRKCAQNMRTDAMSVFQYASRSDFEAFLAREHKKACVRCQPLFTSEWDAPRQAESMGQQQHTQQQRQIQQESLHQQSTLHVAKSSAMGWFGLAASKFARGAAKSAAKVAARRLVMEAMKRMTPR